MSLFTKQIVCRSLFLLLGLIPLSATVGYAAWRHVTYDSAGYQQWIAGQLGLDLQMEHTTHPRPGVVRFDKARILDPESQTEIAVFDRMEVSQGKKDAEACLRIHIPSVVVSQDQFSRLLQLLHDRLLCQTRLLDRAVSVRVDDLKNEQGETLVSDIQLFAKREPNGPYAGLEFRWANDPVMTLKIDRIQTVSPAATHIVLQTHESALPCTLFHELPANLRINKEATFVGFVEMTSHATGWAGTVDGSLSNVHPEAIAILREKFGARLKMPSPTEQENGAVPELKVNFEIDRIHNVLNDVPLD